MHQLECSAHNVKEELRGCHGGNDLIGDVSKFHDVYKGMVVIGKMLHYVLL